MTDRQNIQNEPEDRIRTGRRRFVDFDAAPRDRTVCFTVSDDERDSIDRLAALMGRTRSAVLTRIVTSFVADCSAGDNPEQVLSLFHEYRAAMPLSNIPIDRQ